MKINLHPNLKKMFLASSVLACSQFPSTLSQNNSVQLTKDFYSTSTDSTKTCVFENDTAPVHNLSDHLCLLMSSKKHVCCDKDKSAVISIDAISGKTIIAYNENEPRYPASLTKLMTLFLTFEEIELGRLTMSDRLKVENRNYATKDGLCVLEVNCKEKFTVEQALKGIVTLSAADATDILAYNIAGSMESFVGRMNERAQDLGMTRTHFKNASGRHHPEQITTAHDIAILMRSLMEYFPDQCAVFKTQQFEFHGKPIKNHAIISGADMGKTGTTRASGLNFFSSFPDGDHRYIIGVFGVKDKVSRNKHLLEWRDATQELVKADTILAKKSNDRNQHFSALPPRKNIHSLLFAKQMLAETRKADILESFQAKNSITTLRR